MKNILKEFHNKYTLKSLIKIIYKYELANVPKSSIYNTKIFNSWIIKQLKFYQNNDHYFFNIPWVRRQLFFALKLKILNRYKKFLHFYYQSNLEKLSTQLEKNANAINNDRGSFLIWRFKEYF